MALFKLKNHYVETITSSTINKNDGYVSFCDYGGGFVHRMPKDLFEADAEPVDSLPNEIIHGFVNIDVFIPTKAYYNPHARWNGWATPVFEPKNILALLENMIGTEDDYTRFTATDKSIIYTNVEDDHKEVAEFFNIEFEGKTIQVVEPPCGWCWDIINPQQAVKYYAENLKHNLGKKEAIKQAIKITFNDDVDEMTIQIITEELDEIIHPD